MQVITPPADANHHSATLEQYDENFEPFHQSQEVLQKQQACTNEHQADDTEHRTDQPFGEHRKTEQQWAHKTQEGVQNCENEHKIEQKVSSKAKNMQQDKQSAIKETINRITKNIIFSKQEIVQNISSINRYYQENQRQIKLKHEQHDLQLKQMKNPGLSVKPKGQITSRVQEMDKYRHKEYAQEVKLRRLREKQAKESQEAQQKKMERQKNKQIYEQRRLAKKQQERLEKSQSMLKKMELERRIAYEQKFISRRSLSPEVPISNEEIKQFEDAFIRHIKERLKIGKAKHSQRPHEQAQPMVRQTVPADYRKGYHKKVYKDEKLKQKIIKNLKIQIKQELEPTYSSILIDSNELEDSAALERKRTHQSAPQLRLPAINPVRAAGRTFYSKQKRGKEKVHILKISNDKI